MLNYLIDLRALLGQHILFTLGVMLLLGYGCGRIAGRFGLPEITGFILSGLLVGEAGLGIVPLHMTGSMKVITEVALGLIALVIGSEFSFVKLRRMGREIVVIAALQLLVVFVAVTGTLRLLGLDLPYALILGAIATASSPAVIVAVIHALRAQGPIVEYSYGVIALLDAGAVILFGVSFTLAAGMLGLTAAGASATGMLMTALYEVLFSLLAGVVMGVVVHAAVRRRTNPNEVLLLVLGIAFTTTAVAIVFHLSPLLINMTAGAVLINLTPRHHRLFLILEPMTPPIYALFFVLAGCEMQPALMTDARLLLLGGGYFVARGVGKILSTWSGAWLARTSPLIRGNLGFCMLPEAGVSLGLVLLVQASPQAAGMSPEQLELTTVMVNIVLFSIFLNQFAGPPLAKWAILRGNDMEAR